jgi:hypothetical protein
MLTVPPWYRGIKKSKIFVTYHIISSTLNSCISWEETMTDIIKNGEDITSTTRPASEPSLEYLLSHILSQYQQTTGVPAGHVAHGPETNKDDGVTSIQLHRVTSIQLHPTTHNQAGCPRNFQDFFFSASLHGMDTNKALPWYARARMRYSSTLTAGFVKFLVSELEEAGILELKSSTTGDLVRLSDLEVYTILFAPDKQHAIEMVHPVLGTKLDVVEPTILDDNICSHNLLRCRRTEIVVDPTLGQFTGCLQPYVFRNMDEFVPQIPGTATKAFPTPQEEIELQIGLDSNQAKRSKRPESTPIRVAKSIVRCFQAREDFCWNCHGIASTSTSTLMRCTRCKQALYCGKHCQILHWQTHKTDCHRQEATLA